MGCAIGKGRDLLGGSRLDGCSRLAKGGYRQLFFQNSAHRGEGYAGSVGFGWIRSCPLLLPGGGSIAQNCAGGDQPASFPGEKLRKAQFVQEADGHWLRDAPCREALLDEFRSGIIADTPEGDLTTGEAVFQGAG